MTLGGPVVMNGHLKWRRRLQCWSAFYFLSDEMEVEIGREPRMGDAAAVLAKASQTGRWSHEYSRRRREPS